MSDQKSTQGWWTTLPGVLTASATAITAIGGLIAILGQQGLFHKSTPATPALVASAPEAAPSQAGAAPLKDVVATTTAPAPSVSSSIPASAVPAPVAPARGTIGSNMAYFSGNWQNSNPATAGIIKIQIRIADATMYVRAWAKCRPTNCDWGEVQAQAIGGNVGSQPGSGMREVTAQFRNNVRQVALTIHPAPNDHLRVEAVTNFVDQSGRAPMARIFVFQRM
ncbi:hypothetical protein [Paraburkholderia lycopersici]|uniref:Uncharacterized protein n=1 Tax=Paraburkholderia lycopersici TaxID=416944 RepID=A0A1G6Q105_9BURK|nr:hypothetical protein [Paraburkholderia lycopersici]SDC85466.1 hypothetical protein SAMN05421548_11129 [Paraburkholderia lycopersici]